MARTRQQNEKPSVASKPTSAKSSAPIQKSTTSKKTEVKKSHASTKPVQKISVSNKTAIKKTPVSQNPVQRASAPNESSTPRESTPKMPTASTPAQPMSTLPARTQVPNSSSGSFAATPSPVLNTSGPSHMQRRPLVDNRPWRICIIKDEVEWKLDARMSTVKYATWAHTPITLSPESFARVINHPDAVYKINRLRANNELNGPFFLDFNSAYAETTTGERHNVTNVIIKDLNNRTVELVWDMILRTELAVLNPELAAPNPQT